MMNTQYIVQHAHALLTAPMATAAELEAAQKAKRASDPSELLGGEGRDLAEDTHEDQGAARPSRDLKRGT